MNINTVSAECAHNCCPECTFEDATGTERSLGGDSMKTCPNCGKPLDALGLCPDAKPDDVRKGFAFCSAIPVTESHPESCSCDRCKLTRKIVSA